MAGVPYAVICRQAFGVFGANIPAVIRGLIAFARYGIQTYLAANALMLVLLKFWPSLASLTSSSFLGLSPLGWLCFATMWLLQAMVFWHGMNAIKRFIDIAGPAVYVVMLALAGWIVYKTGLDGISFTLASKSLSAGEQTADDHRHGAGGLPTSGPLLNFGDFSRYGKSMGEIRRGNRWGLPFNFLLFSVVTVVIVSGTQSLFGKMITDPIETVSRVGNDLAVAIGLLTMITATIGINIVANFVSPAFDFSNCAPQKISFRTGGMIAAVGSILLTPWNLFNSPELIHYTLDVLGAFIGPLFGILIADFYLIKRGRVSVDDLFDDTPQGKYWYRNGFNPKAIAALLPSVGLGLIISFIPALHEVANFSWFIGVFSAPPPTAGWLATSVKCRRKPPSAPARWRKRVTLLPRRLAAAGCKLAPILLFITIPRALREGRFDDGLPDRGARCIFDIAGVAETPDEVAARARYLDDGLLFLQEGKLSPCCHGSRGSLLHPLKGYVDLRGKLLLPGFVDAHVHYPQTEMIGAFGEQLLEWLTTYTFPVESQFADAEYAREIAQFL